MLEKRQAAAIAHSLDADPALLPFLPELLADLTSLGYPPDRAVHLSQQHLGDRQALEMLDFGCGKGACLIALAKAFGWHGIGVDLFPPFIQDARNMAKQEGLGSLLRFEVGDMVSFARSSQQVDLVIFGHDSEVFGDLNGTLQAIFRPIKPGGHLLLETVWQKETLSPSDEAPTFNEVQAAIALAGLTLVGEAILGNQEVRRLDAANTAKIRRRANALIQRFPQHEALLRGYIDAQEKASVILNTAQVCALLLIRKTP